MTTTDLAAPKSSGSRFNANLFPLGQFRFLEPGEKIEVGDLVMYECGKLSHQVDIDYPTIGDKITYDDTMLPILRKRRK